jgi:hypothetical protein
MKIYRLAKIIWLRLVRNSHLRYRGTISKFIMAKTASSIFFGNITDSKDLMMLNLNLF